MAQVIIIGGGLSGMSAAHTVLQSGGRVLVIDKSPFCGGNSTKATSGINAAGTRAQRALGIPDTPEVFEQDTTVSASHGARPDLIRVLTHESGPAVDWLEDSFGLDLSVIARLAAHTHPRTHRGKERFPGMMITYGLMEKLDTLAEQSSDARVVNKATVTQLLTDGGSVVGVEFEKGGQLYKEYGPVVVATGGFGADFTENSLLSQVEGQWNDLEAWTGSSRAGKQGGGRKIPTPPLRSLPTTNGPHCTGDGIKLAMGVGAGTFDLHYVQVHPTGLLDPAEPDAKVKFLAAEALRGSGALLLDREGNRFCDELGKRDYVSGRMWSHGKPPYRLVLNSAAVKQISWHCEHYSGRGLMKPYTGAALAQELGISKAKLQSTFSAYNGYAANPATEPWGKKYFNAVPFSADDNGFMVAIVGPIVHYCMGGVAANEVAEVITPQGAPIPGLFVGGEAMGGIHGDNRLGGSSLLDCVVFGRIAGRSASKYLLNSLLAQGPGRAPGSSTAVSAGGRSVNVQVTPSGERVTVEVSFGGAAGASAASSSTTAQGSSSGGGGGGSAMPTSLDDDPNQAFYSIGGDDEKKADGAKAPAGPKLLTAEEVSKHNSDSDCWVVISDKVYDVTEFLPDHPGGKKAIMLYAGKDATKEFLMLHKPQILTKYASEYYVGDLQTSRL